MPRALEPNQRFSVVLDFDKAKPEDQQPRFWFRALSLRDYRALYSKVEALEESENTDQAYQRMMECLSFGLVGWENMVDPQTGEEIAFDIDTLPDIVDPFETRELVYAMAHQNRVSVEDKKNSASSPSSNAESSAENADPDAAKPN